MATKRVFIFIGLLFIAFVVFLFCWEFPISIPFPKVSLIPKDSVLDLSDKAVKSLPAEIGRYVWVQELYLQDNLLTGALPAEIGRMANLIILDASNNQLTGISAEIGQLRKLQILNLSDNLIDTYPNEIQNLKNNLITLNLTGNPFAKVDIENLRKILPNTEVIY